MRAKNGTLGLVLLVLGAFVAKGCDPVPIDDSRNDKRLFSARGVIRGTVTYTGPRPCSRSGSATLSSTVSQLISAPFWKR